MNSAQEGGLHCGWNGGLALGWEAAIGVLKPIITTFRPHLPSFCSANSNLGHSCLHESGGPWHAGVKGHTFLHLLVSGMDLRRHFHHLALSAGVQQRQHFSKIPCITSCPPMGFPKAFGDGVRQHAGDSWPEASFPFGATMLATFAPCSLVFQTGFRTLGGIVVCRQGTRSTFETD